MDDFFSFFLVHTWKKKHAYSKKLQDRIVLTCGRLFTYMLGISR